MIRPFFLWRFPRLRRFGARGVGIDIDLQRIHESIENKKRYGIGDKVSFRRESFFDTDLSPATVVTMYLLPGINVKLRLRRRQANGARLFSIGTNSFK